MMQRQVKAKVVVKVVAYGDGEWGIAATLDGRRSHIHYVVGDRKAAEAEAERLKQTAKLNSLAVRASPR